MFKIPSWPILANLGNNKIVKSSYIWIVIVPILGKLLNNLPDKIYFSIQEEYFLLDFVLPFSWKLLFFSALFFALATFLFNLKCPALIKNFTDVEAFKSKGLTKNQLLIFFSTWIRKKHTAYDASGKKINLIHLITSINNEYSEDKDEIGNLTPDNLDKAIRKMNLKSQSEIDVYWIIRSVMSNTLLIYRLIIATLYAMGFCILAYILFLNILIVIKI